MNERMLKSRGWTKKEVSHARRILKKADGKRPRWMDVTEHLMLWTVVVVLASAALGFLLQLIPLIILMETGVGATFLFVTSACVGLLLVHILHDLHMARGYQHAGAAALVVISTITTIRVIQITGISVGKVAPPFIFGVAVMLGICIPYLIHWRFTHETA